MLVSCTFLSSLFDADCVAGTVLDPPASAFARELIMVIP